MTTLTTHPLPLLPLILPYRLTPASASTIPSTTDISPVSSPASSSGTMHPDTVMLQGHGVTSPRLSIGPSDLNTSQLSSLSLLNHMKTNSTCCDSPRSQVSDADGVVTSAASRADRNDVTMTDADEVSCCSEDSELSVGQEGCDNNKTNLSEEQSTREISSNNSSGSSCNKFFLNSDSDNNVGRQLMSIPSIMNRNDPIDNESVSSVSAEDIRMTEQNDELSNDSSLLQQRNNIEVDPILMANALRIPVPIVRPSPTRFQEEFLRKSHIYAEELMKQQMQFMAAARANAFSMRHPAITPQDVGKIGFRPHIKQMNEALPNFSGIHSHLSAISKISSQISNNESPLSKLTAFGMGPSREPSQSPPTLNQLHQQIQQHLPFMNNNLHEPSLKFSIDNILKADFGRRITDPLLKKGNSNRKNNAASRAERLERSQRGEHKRSGTPIDLTPQLSASAASSICSNSNDSSSTMISAYEKSQHQHVSPIKSPSSLPSATATSANCLTSPNGNNQPSSTAGSSNGAGEGNNNGGSSSTSSSSSSSRNGDPMVWPAWVYCTRYSDRPSSGPRTRKPKKPPGEKASPSSNDEKRPRTAFSGSQLARLKHEFTENRYLTEKRRQQLSNELGLNEAQIKIWFQNKRAKIKKSSGTKNPLALQLMAQGLYNHSTVPLTKEEEELQALQAEADSS